MKKDFDNLLRSYGINLQNLPTRITPTSKTCFDHMITTKEHKTETLETTMSDHLAVTPEITLMLKNCKRLAPVKKRET